MAEKEYIEREALLRYLNDIWLFAIPNDSMPDDDRQLAIVRCMGLNDAMDAVKSIPAADVRPVVLCIECKHSCDMFGGLRCCHGTCVDCYVEPEFFCAEGEKEEES